MSAGINSRFLIAAESDLIVRTTIRVVREGGEAIESSNQVRCHGRGNDRQISCTSVEASARISFSSSSVFFLH